MDVVRRMRTGWPILLAAYLSLTWVPRVPADPVYTAIDLGTGTPTFGVDSTGNGTITGSNGQAYTFKPSPNDLPAQWQNTTQGVPAPDAAPVNDPMTYGNPKYAFSTSHLYDMNGHGLAAGIDQYGVAGHLANSTAFFTQQQPDGSWGTPIPIWSGSTNFADQGPFNIGIMGVSANGQVLGYGDVSPYTGGDSSTLYLYDTKTHTLTNMTSLIDSMKWTKAPQLPNGPGTNWFLSSIVSQIDDQGRILVQASEGGGLAPPHYVLLIPQGSSVDAVPAPEPAAWAVFATLVGGWMARRRLGSRTPDQPCHRAG